MTSMRRREKTFDRALFSGPDSTGARFARDFLLAALRKNSRYYPSKRSPGVTGGSSDFLGDPPPDPRFLASLGAQSWVELHHCCILRYERAEPWGCLGVSPQQRKTVLRLCKARSRRHPIATTFDILHMHETPLGHLTSARTT
jgi:hypothetical protein